MYSEYVDSLSDNVKSRYLEKISAISGVDPYLLKDVSTEVQDFPKITHGDIVNYLVFERSSYTMDEFKAFKSLDSYNQFLCGWVKEIAVKNINDLCVVVGKVLHSQRLKQAALAIWIIAKPDGHIISAHCNCVAGLGETCSHVGALLFTIEDNIRNIETRSVTGVKAYWKVPSAHPGALAASKDIDYTSSFKLSKVCKGEAEVSQRSKDVDETVPLATPEEIVRSLQALKDEDLQCALFSAVPPFCEDFQQSRLRNVLADLYKEEYETKDLDSLIAIGKEINILLTDEQCEYLEKITRKQSKCYAWFEFRLGRITASNFKQCVRTKIEKPSMSLLKKICYPTTRQFKNAATAYGCTHEQDAVNDFSKYMKNHENLNVTTVGFVINSKFPQVGASPDSLVDCSCCEPACLEVKCPFCARDMSIEEATSLKNFCLKNKEQYFLPKDHQYFYQCQMQMAVTGRRLCYFVVWTKNELHVEKIAFNEESWNINLNQAHLFFTNVIIPELLGKWYTRKTRALEVASERETASVSVYCICKKSDDGKPMIACDNKNCPIEWYHMSCVGLSVQDIPGVWNCQLCNSD